MARSAALAAPAQPVEVGGVALESDAKRDADAHRAAVIASSGKYPEAFTPDHLAALGEGWPA
jgi:hypothetical protein